MPGQRETGRNTRQRRAHINTLHSQCADINAQPQFGL